MGRDPATSVLNRHNQAHDVPNLFITDGSCMTSSGTVNPSLTYMALSARAANYAADLLGLRRDVRSFSAARRAQPLAAGLRRGRTRTSSSRNPGVTARSAGSTSASAKRIRAAQAEDSATTVILPLSRVHRFTLLASSGPNAFITATCHSDVFGRRKGTLGQSWQTRRD